MGFSKVTPPPHVAWADEVPDAGLASPDPGPAEQVLAMSPKLYVQIGIWKVTIPALVDSGSGSNCIDQGVADTLKLKLLPLKVPTKIRWANGHLMECVSYVVIPERLGSLRFRLSPRRLFVHGYHFGHPLSAPF